MYKHPNSRKQRALQCAVEEKTSIYEVENTPQAIENKTPVNTGKNRYGAWADKGFPYEVDLPIVWEFDAASPWKRTYKVSPHKTLHATRALAEDYIYKELSDFNVVDVGARMSRHWLAGRRLHGVMPCIMPADNFRAVPERKCATSEGNLTMCAHRIEDCNCIPKNPGFMMVDSLYYLKPEVVAWLASLGPVIAFHHVYPGFYGKFEGLSGIEGEWVREPGTKTVYTHITGDPVEVFFEHNDLSWINKPIPVVVNNCKRFLVNKSMMFGKYHAITSFTLTDIEPQISSVIAVFQIKNVRKIISEGQDLSMYEGADVYVEGSGKDKCWRVGDLYAPDCVVQGVSTMCLGRERNTDLFTQCLAKAKSLLKGINEFPQKWITKCILGGAVIGFLKDVEYETKQLEILHSSTNKISAKIHSTALDGTPMTWFEKLKLYTQDYCYNNRYQLGFAGLVGLTVGMAVMRIASKFESKPKSLVPNWDYALGIGPRIEECLKRKWVSKQITKGFDVSQARVKSALKITYMERFYGDDLWLRFKTHYYLLCMDKEIAIDVHRLLNYNCLVSGRYPYAKDYISAINNLFEYEGLGSYPIDKIINERLTIKRVRYEYTGVVPSYVNTDERRVQPVYHLGLASPAFLPSVPHPDFASEYVCIAERVTNPPVIKKGMVDKFIKFVKDFRDKFVDESIMKDFFLDYYGSLSSSVYLPKWLEHYKASQQRLKTVAINDIRERGKGAYMQKVTLFEKIEKNFKSTPVENKGLVPRPIQNMSQSGHVILGPVYYAYSDALKRAFVKGVIPIYYVTGETAESIYHMLGSHPIKYVGDSTKFDRSVHKVIVELWNCIMKKYTVPDNFKSFIDKIVVINGVTMVGRWRYRRIGQRGSGDDNTSCHNSEINVFLHLFCIYYALIVKGSYEFSIFKKFSIMVLGDDIVVGGPLELQQVDFEGIMQALGFLAKPKFTTQSWDVDFCSRLFWPTTRGGVLACKPGRMLLRLPWSCKPGVDFSEVCYGAYLDNSCVPFVRKYLLQQLSRKPSNNPILQPYRPHATQFHEANDETWVMVYSRYGLTVKDEVAYEEWLTQWDGGPAVGQHWTVRLMIQVDCDLYY